jgi:hypothetical protein
MIPHLLRSGIFALSDKTAAQSRVLPRHDDVSDLTDGGSVEYKGPRLKQRDLRYSLGLMQLSGGLHSESAEVTFHADDFLRMVGRENPCTDTVEGLRDSLSSLRSATFIVRQYAKDRGVVFGFIDSVTWDKRMCAVRMSPMAHKAVDVLGFTLLPLAVRNKLKDGIQTALADIFWSTSATSFDIDALAEIFGRQRDAGQFGKEVRLALPRLVKAGVLTGWSKTRGRVHVDKASRF